MKDFLIIGAGYAGISVGALLAKEGYSVEIIESHNLIGGCASYFRKKNFLFDVGATTLSGVLGHQPLGLLFHTLGIKPELEKMEIGIRIYQENSLLNRFSNLDQWIDEAERFFVESRKSQKKFWKRIAEIDQLSWEFISSNLRLPPRGFTDLLHLSKPRNWNKISLLYSLFKPLKYLLDKYDIHDKKFEKFLSEQLLITTQSTIEKAPLLTSAMGLAYPSETYYPIGGITKPLELIFQKFISYGGTISLKETVKKIDYSENKINLTTHKNKVFESKYLVSTIPIWNMKEICSGKVQTYYEKLCRRFPEGPGAFTINFGIEMEASFTGGYYQIHTPKKIPYCDAGAFFLTVSHALDDKKSPTGFRSITISTHTNAKEWSEVAGEDYRNKKDEITKYILENLESTLPEFKDKEKIFLSSGSPKTFARYTKREQGFVGGIPHSINPNLLLMPPNKTPFHGLFQGGDTAFPGQGTPAVVQGAFQILNYSKNL